MENINSTVIAGNLVADAKCPKEGVLSFTVATTTRVKVNEEWQDRPSYIDCVMFGKRADAIKDLMKKGKKVICSGKLYQNRWEKDGKTQSRVELRIDNIEIPSDKSNDVPFEY